MACLACVHSQAARSVLHSHSLKPPADTPVVRLIAESSPGGPQARDAAGWMRGGAAQAVGVRAHHCIQG